MFPKKLFFVVFAFIFLFATAGAATCNSITQYGITWTFDKAYECGQFVNGDSWVKGLVVVSSVSPAWDNTKNGSMIDPFPNSSQGYDTRADDFSSSDRVTFPVTINPSGGTKSLVSSIGLGSCASGGAAQCLSDAAVLTIVADTVPDGSFRPAYAYGAKTIYNVSQLNYNLVPKVPKPAGVSIPNFNADNFAKKVWLDQGHVVWGTTIHPSNNMPPYPRDSSQVVSQLSMLVMLDIPERNELINRLVQLGIDLYSVSLMNDDAFRAYGGFGNGRKWPILFAGIVLNNSGMKNPPAKIDYNPAIDKFGEDGHTYYGKPTSSYPQGQPLWGQDCVADGYSPPFFTNHDCRDPNGVLEPEAMANGGTYRICCTSGTWAGQALAARMMGAIAIWNHQAFFDYVDYWINHPEEWQSSGSASESDSSGYSGDGGGFMTYMWQNYRGATASCKGTDANCGTYPSCSACGSGKTCVSNSCQDIQCTDGAITGACYCAGTLRTAGSGYCCSNAYQAIACGSCVAGTTQSCTTGLQGICLAGTKICQANGTWPSACTQTNTAATENCSDSLDNDCDGSVDCGDSDCYTNPSCVVAGIPSGYVSFWKFDGTANDEAGRANGTLAGNASYVPGKYGQALNLDGSGDYVSVDGVSSAIATGSVSVATWIRLPSNYGSGSATEIILRLGDTPSNNDIHLSLENGKLNFNLFNGSDFVSAVSSQSSWTASTWYLVAGTYDGSIAKVYVNGQLAGQSGNVSRGTTASTHARIGASYNDIGSVFFNGQMDNFVVYNRALTATEILGMYNPTSTACDNPALMNYVLQWKTGSIAISTLMQKIGAWKAGTAC